MEYKGKRFIKFLATTKDFRLGFNARLLYSHLVWRAGLDRGHSAANAAKATGLDRQTGIASARDSLVSAGLVRVEKRQMFANRPTNRGWFWWFNKNEEWHRDFQYAKVYMPSESSQLTVRDHVLLGYLGFRGKQDKIAYGVCNEYLGACLDVDARVIGKGLERLKRFKLIETKGYSARFDIHLLDPYDCLPWFQDEPGDSEHSAQPALHKTHEDAIITQVDEDCNNKLGDDHANDSSEDAGRCEGDVDRGWDLDPEEGLCGSVHPRGSTEAGPPVSLPSELPDWSPIEGLSLEVPSSVLNIDEDIEGLKRFLGDDIVFDN